LFWCSDWWARSSHSGANKRPVPRNTSLNKTGADTFVRAGFVVQLLAPNEKTCEDVELSFGVV
jgi:hypothetical protein